MYTYCFIISSCKLVSLSKIVQICNLFLADWKWSGFKEFFCALLFNVYCVMLRRVLKRKIDKMHETYKSEKIFVVIRFGLIVFCWLCDFLSDRCFRGVCYLLEGKIFKPCLPLQFSCLSMPPLSPLRFLLCSMQGR